MPEQAAVGQPAFLAWAAAGFGAELLPLHAWDDQTVSLERRGKKPKPAGWDSLVVTEAMRASWSMQRINAGLRTRHFPALDIDVDAPAVAAAVEEVAVRILGRTAKRTRSNSSRCALLYRLEGAPFPKIKIEFTLPDGEAAKVESLADGQQIVIAGTHSSGVPIAWDTAPEAAHLAPLSAAWRTVLFTAIRARLLELGCTLAHSDPEPVRATPAPTAPLIPGTWEKDREVAEYALDRISADCPYDQWIAVGMALHAKDPAISGPAFAAWDAWSSRSEGKYKGTRELENHWRSFKAGGVHFGTLLAIAGVKPSDVRRPKLAVVPPPEPPEGIRESAEDIVAPEPVPEPARKAPGANEDAPEASQPSPRVTLASLSIGAALAREESRLEHPIPRISTGWPRLDKVLGGGLEIPSLTVLGAPPKGAKSTWAQIVAVRHAEAGGVAYVLDLENGSRRFLRRVLCRKAELGSSAVARALAEERRGVFTSRLQVHMWHAAKAWLRDDLEGRLFVEHFAPPDFLGRLKEVREAAKDRKLLIVVDSMQKLPGDPRDDRRTTIDKWTRLLERARFDLDAAILAISEIRRGKEGYSAREDAFKESGGIEYAADLALTMNRAAADEEEEDPVSTMRVELARDCEEDPRGDVASYRPVRPYYGLEEVEAVPLGKKKAGRPSTSFDAACDFLRGVLAEGAISTDDLMSRARSESHSERTIERARKAVGAVRCTVNLKSGWRLP